MTLVRLRFDFKSLEFLPFTVQWSIRVWKPCIHILEYSFLKSNKVLSITSKKKKKSVLEFIIVVLFLMPIYLNVYEDFGETWGGWLFVLKVIFIFLSLLNGGLDNDWIWGLKMGIVWFGLVFLYCTLQFEIWIHKIMWKRLIFLLALAYCFINDIITTYGVIVSCIK